MLSSIISILSAYDLGTVVQTHKIQSGLMHGDQVVTDDNQFIYRDYTQAEYSEILNDYVRVTEHGGAWLYGPRSLNTVDGLSIVLDENERCGV